MKRMNLEQFIQESISQIVAGISRAQESLKDTGACVAPGKIWTPDASSQTVMFLGPRSEDCVGRYVSLLEFDVGLEVEATGKGEGKLQISARVPGIVSADVAGGGDRSTAKREIQRIKFAVPVAFPEVQA